MFMLLSKAGRSTSRSESESKGLRFIQITVTTDNTPGVAEGCYQDVHSLMYMLHWLLTHFSVFLWVLLLVHHVPG